METFSEYTFKAPLDPLPVCLLSHQGLATPSLPHWTPWQRSPLTQVGHQVDEAHQQESTHAEHHEQEEEQNGGHWLHGVVAKMPLREAHVHQLPVEVIEGRLSSTQPGPALLLPGAGTPQGGTMTPTEKALESEDRERETNESRESFLGDEALGKREISGLGPALPHSHPEPCPPFSAIPRCHPQESQQLSHELSEHRKGHLNAPCGAQDRGETRQVKAGWTTGYSIQAGIFNTSYSFL